MTITPPSLKFLRSLHTCEVSAIDLAKALGDTLLMSAHALRQNPAALVQVCQQLHPEAGPADAVKLVHEQVKDLPSSVAAFSDRWNAIRQEMLNQTRFLRQAAIERDDQIGYELRQLNAKLTSEAAQAQAKRKALIDAGVTADEAARLSPEPSDTAYAEQSAALHAERLIYTEFDRTLDAALLPEVLHERAKQMELQKDWIGTPLQVPA